VEQVFALERELVDWVQWWKLLKQLSFSSSCLEWVHGVICLVKMFWFCFSLSLMLSCFNSCVTTSYEISVGELNCSLLEQVGGGGYVAFWVLVHALSLLLLFVFSHLTIASCIYHVTTVLETSVSWGWQALCDTTCIVICCHRMSTACIFWT
jgi:hypothetical protein